MALRTGMMGLAALALSLFLLLLAPIARADDWYRDPPLQRAITSVFVYAETHWDCIQPDCKGGRVPKSGSGGQGGFACAEFVARALAAGNLIPGLSPDAPQKDYESNYKYKGVHYNLVRTSSKNKLLGPGETPPPCLEDLLIKLGWTQVAIKTENVHMGVVIFGNSPSEGAWGHVVLGVGNNQFDGHNLARHNEPLSTFLNGPGGGVRAIYKANSVPS